MIKRFFTFILFVSIVNQLQAVEASITHCVLYSQNNPYLELYTRFKADDILYLHQANGKYAELEAVVLIKQGISVIVGDKYKIRSPLDSLKSDFWDIKRYNIPPGQYQMVIEISNKNYKEDPVFKMEKDLTIAAAQPRISLSDPLFISAYGKDETLPFEKHGVNYEALAYNLVLPEMNRLSFYVEVNRIDANWNEDFFVKYEIREGLPGASDEAILLSSKKLAATDYIPLFLEMDIKDVVSGNYTLHVTAGDRKLNTLDEKAIAFSVYKPLADIRKATTYNVSFENSFVQHKTRSELDYALKAIFPQVGNNMTEILNYVITSNDIKSKKYYLYTYWSQIAPESPELVYNQYMEVARAVDIKFQNNVGKGFETDRGYIFMKYGRPNDIIAVEDEPSAPPYEIWVYENVPTTQQSNVKFLFFSPSLSHNNFELLHSTCRGERNNPQWELELYRDSPNEVNDNIIDARTVSGNWNRNARRYFEDN